MRFGIPNQTDVIVGTAFIVLLLEATRRSLGPALAIIAAVFLLYALTGPRGLIPITLPDLISHRGYQLDRLISQMFVTTEGIFGVALGVSTQFVFLFVLFGSMLDKAGAGKYFIDLANAFLGMYRGGAAKASVVSSGLTGMVSGSSLANVVTTGTFTIPLMKRTGFPAYKAGAVEVAVSTNGQLMPPVMGAAAFIIAEFTGLPYIDVVTAAFIPAVISYLALFYIVPLEALKLRSEEHTSELQSRGHLVCRLPLAKKNAASSDSGLTARGNDGGNRAADPSGGCRRAGRAVQPPTDGGTDRSGTRQSPTTTGGTART